MMKRLGLLLLFLSLFCCTLLVQGAFPEEAQLWKISEQATVKRYPDADSVLLYDQETVRVEPSGASRRIDRMAIKILTEKGRRESRVFRFYCNDRFEKIHIPNCAILRNGKTITVDPDKNSRLAVESSQMDENIYDPHDKTLTLTLPDVRIGDVILLTMEENNFKPRMQGVYCGIFGLQGTQPVLHYEVEIDTPLPLRSTAVKNESVPVKFHKESGKGREIYRWSVENVPQVIPEPDMPPVYLCAQRLLVSTAGDYAEVSRWYDGICRPRLAEVSPEMKKTVEELIKTAGTPREKADAVFQFVSQKIRYMGITDEKEVPGYEPHPVKITFAKRYGVCRDKAALLVAMLRLAGLEAHPVLFYAGEPKDGEVPNNYFNHAVAAVKLEGKIFLMDPTYENTREWLPSFESEMSYLVASPQGTGLALSPAAPAEGNGIAVSTRAVLGENGDLRAESQFAFHGTDDLIYRSSFARRKKEFQREFFVQLLQKSFPGAVLDDLTIEPQDLRDMSKPLAAKLTFHASAAGNTALRNLALPFFGNRIGSTALQLGNCSLQKRLYPLTLMVPSCVKEELEVTLPDNLRCAAPRRCMRSGEVMDVQCATQEKENKVQISRRIVLKKKRIQPEEYAEMKQTLAALERFDRGGLLLQSVQNAGADMEILRSDTGFELLSPDAAVVTQEVEEKILTYGGVKHGSELHIAFNPAQEEVSFVKGEVVTPDGKVLPVSAKEQNLMDAPGADAAPSYSPNQILAVSFPGVTQGCTIRYTVKRVMKNRPGIAFLQCFASGSPIRSMTLRVKDKTGKLQRKVLAPDGVIQVRNEADGTTVYSRQNIPAIKAEAHAPAALRFAPAVLLGNTTPRSFAKALNDTLEKQTLDQPKAAAQAKVLVKECRTTEEKIRAIRDFVAVRIREAGPALNELPYTAFSPADATLERGCGNSADRAILLAAMLRAAELPAAFFAVSDLPFPEERGALLSPLLFTQVMVRSGSFVLNGSSQYAPLTIRPFSPGAVALMLPEGQWRRGYPDSMLRRSFRIRVAEDGSAEIQCRQEYSGREGEVWNREWSEMTPARRAQYAETLLSSLSHSAEMLRFPERTETSEQGKFCLSYVVKVRDFCSLDGKIGSFELPGFRKFSSLLPGSAEQRTTPIDWRFPSYVVDEWEITLPEKRHFLRLPEEHSVTIGGMHFQTRVKPGKERVTVTASAIPGKRISGLPSAMLAPQNGALLNQWKKTWEAMEQRIILFQMEKEK